MFPWLFMWAPQVHYPWSGDVTQRIAPKTSWFSDNISPESGNADIEEQAFQIASYGKQLGLINEVLIGLDDKEVSLSKEAHLALDKLREIDAQIQSIKAEHKSKASENLREQLLALKQSDPKGFQSIIEMVNN